MIPLLNVSPVVLITENISQHLRPNDIEKMSVRADPSRFNLRTVLPEDNSTKTAFIFNQIAPQVERSLAAQTDSSETKRSLKFDFSSLQTNARTGGASPVSTPVNKIGFSSKPAPVISGPLRNPFETHAESNKADVMRMTVMVEDLNARVKKATERASLAEAQLQKVNMALMTEKKTFLARSKALSNELTNARAVESQLRTELTAVVSKLEKQTARTEKFESAVAAAMAADETNERSQREIVDMKAKIKLNDSKMSLLTQELIEMNDKNKKISLERDTIKSEHTRACSELSAVVADRDSARESLSQALSRASKAEHDAHTLRVRAESAEKTACMVHASPKKTTETSEEDTKDTVKVIPKSPPEDDAKSETMDKKPTGVPDPVKMHTRYEKIRHNVLALSHEIEKLTKEGGHEKDVEKLLEKRDSLHMKASRLKSRYDRIFGIVEKEEEKLNETTEHGADFDATVDGSVPTGSPQKAVLDLSSFKVYGQAPDDSAAFCNGIHKESVRCILGGSIYIAGMDVSPEITLTPADLSLFDFSEGIEKKTPEATGEHDATSDMINAVVSDLTLFLKDADAREKAIRNEILNVSI